METKNVKSSRRKYDVDFKKEVIRMIESGRSVPDVAQSLGIGTNSDLSMAKSAPKHPQLLVKIHQIFHSMPRRAEPAMHKKIKDLEMERDILKKALGIFSR